jgi:hypothetical protein
MHKIGDKVYCKNSLLINNNGGLFIKGDVCEIKEVDCNNYRIYYSNKGRGWTTFIKTISRGISLTFFNSHEFNIFSEYFYSVIELRKLKLENIEKLLYICK